MAVIGASNIYAAGDMAKYPFHLPHGSKDPLVRIEHWNVASQQGRHAALAIAGKPKPLRLVPYFWTAQYVSSYYFKKKSFPLTEVCCVQKGRNLRFCGHALHFSDIIIDGNLQELTFVAYFTEGETVLAVASLGRDPVVSHCSELMRLGKMPFASELRAGKVRFLLLFPLWWCFRVERVSLFVILLLFSIFWCHTIRISSRWRSQAPSARACEGNRKGKRERENLPPSSIFSFVFPHHHYGCRRHWIWLGRGQHRPFPAQ